MTHLSLTKSLLSIVAGAAAGLGLGCILTTGGGGSRHDCGGTFSHSHETANDSCKCDAGYTFENPSDPEDFACERIEPKPGECDGANQHLEGDDCFCDDGFNWCLPNNPNDFSCCDDPAQDSLSGTGTGDPTDTDVTDTVADTGTGTTDDPTAADTTEGCNDSGIDPDPADCTVDAEGLFYCSNTAAAGPQGGEYWVCMGGTWVDMPTAGDESCQFDGFDFSYGCVDNGTAVEFVCGNGPGTDCDGSTEAVCVDNDVINACFFGKLTEDSCATICNTLGDEDGVTYDSGFCDADSVPPDCFCCDAGEEGCPE